MSVGQLPSGSVKNGVHCGQMDHLHVPRGLRYPFILPIPVPVTVSRRRNLTPLTVYKCMYAPLCFVCVYIALRKTGAPQSKRWLYDNIFLQ